MYADGPGIGPGDHTPPLADDAWYREYYQRRWLLGLTANKRADLLARGEWAPQILIEYFRARGGKEWKEKIKLPKAVRAALIEQPNVITGFAVVARSITPPFSDSEMRYIIEHCNTDNLRGMLQGEISDQVYRLMAEGEATPPVRKLIREGKVPPSVLSSMAASRDPRKRAAAALGIYLPPEDENRLFSDEDPDVRAAMATTIPQRIERARKYQDTDLIKHYENMRRKLANDPEPKTAFQLINSHAFTEEGAKAIAEIRSTRFLTEIHNALGSEKLWPTTEEYWEEVWSPGNYMDTYKRTRVNKKKQEMVDSLKKQIRLKLGEESK